MTKHEPGGRSPRQHRPARPVPAAVVPAARGISQVTALVPHLLGYLPDHSLVLLTVQPDGTSGHGVVRGAVGFTLRVDLPDLEQLGELPELLARPVWHGTGGDERGGATIVHAIVYDAPEDGDGQPSQVYLDRLSEVLQELCEQLDVLLHDLVLVRPVRAAMPAHERPATDRQRAMDERPATDRQRATDEPGPADGPARQVLEHRPLLRAGERLDLPWAPLPTAADVPAAADLVLRGRSPLGSRDELAARVRHRDEKASAATSLAVDLLALSPGRLDQDHALSRLGAWVVHGEPVTGVKDRAWIAVLLQDRTLRDAVLARWVPALFDLEDILPPVEAAAVRRHVPPLPKDEALASVGRLITLAGQVPLDLAAPLLTLAGFTAWAQGEGTLALEAGRHALEADPDYRMAQLLDRALATGMRPPTLAQRRAAEREDRPGVA